QYYKAVHPYYSPGVDLKAPYVGALADLDLSEADYAHALLNDMGWEIFPQGLYDSLRKLQTIAPGLPILISENGTAEIVDHNRASFFTSHILELQRAIDDGVRVTGYLHWSCADNWEWVDGYRKEARFGLFSVDHSQPDSVNKTHFITDGALAFANL